ncbi:GntR family transcriptional regulator [Kribbella speibonae]|uniref:GntR family transcriptional regulator n=1 Tax=Kribbella speibonae TaxID=1572660 RepID=A0A4R0IB68_9ACTN|nr:GntR family transcriptional regulator [Kribbella speibonae]TCC22680.1 GntR family transcriptional regulator [Kribbella speibonae]TCC29040.1 GntR family transcriptional regulator [Kribbella speibonae]
MSTEARLELGPSSLTDALYESIRKRIVNGEIPQGEKLTEVRLATEYNVARPTAKAALERLTALGLLRRTAHKTAVVPVLDEAEIRDLFFSRITIEKAAVSTLAATGQVPADAARAQVAIEYAARDRLFENQVEADIAFHTALVAAVGSRRLTRMHELIIGEVQLTMGQYQAHRKAAPTTVAEEHAAILKSIEEGAPDAAAEHLAYHLEQAQGRLLSTLSGD